MGTIHHEPSGMQPGVQALQGNHLDASVRDGSARNTGATGPSNHQSGRELRSRYGSAVAESAPGCSRIYAGESSRIAHLPDIPRFYLESRTQ